MNHELTFACYQVELEVLSGNPDLTRKQTTLDPIYYGILCFFNLNERFVKISTSRLFACCIVYALHSLVKLHFSYRMVIDLETHINNNKFV